MTNEDSRYLCPECWGFVDHRRIALGYRTCLPCGEAHAREVKHCIVPMPKSNYIVVTDYTLLKGLNSSHKGAR
jgi:ribosomal protein L37AE/L43A